MLFQVPTRTFTPGGPCRRPTTFPLPLRVHHGCSDRGPYAHHSTTLPAPRTVTLITILIPFYIFPVTPTVVPISVLGVRSTGDLFVTTCILFCRRFGGGVRFACSTPRLHILLRLRYVYCCCLLSFTLLTFTVYHLLLVRLHVVTLRSTRSYRTSTLH